MENENKKDLVVGILLALASSAEDYYNKGQANSYKVACGLINEIYANEVKND